MNTQQLLADRALRFQLQAVFQVHDLVRAAAEAAAVDQFGLDGPDHAVQTLRHLLDLDPGGHSLDVPEILPDHLGLVHVAGVPMEEVAVVLGNLPVVVGDALLLVADDALYLAVDLLNLLFVCHFPLSFMVITLVAPARPGARLLPISAFFCTFGRSFRLEYAAKIQKIL